MNVLYLSYQVTVLILSVLHVASPYSCYVSVKDGSLILSKDHLTVNVLSIHEYHFLNPLYVTTDPLKFSKSPLLTISEIITSNIHNFNAPVVNTVTKPSF